MYSEPGASAYAVPAREGASQGQIAFAGIALLLIFAIGSTQNVAGAVTSLYALPLMLVAGSGDRRVLAGLAVLTALLVLAPLFRLANGEGASGWTSLPC